MSGKTNTTDYIAKLNLSARSTAKLAMFCMDRAHLTTAREREDAQRLIRDEHRYSACTLRKTQTQMEVTLIDCYGIPSWSHTFEAKDATQISTAMQYMYECVDDQRAKRLLSDACKEPGEVILKST